MSRGALVCPRPPSHVVVATPAGDRVMPARRLCRLPLRAFLAGRLRAFYGRAREPSYTTKRLAGMRTFERRHEVGTHEAGEWRDSEEGGSGDSSEAGYAR